MTRLFTLNGFYLHGTEAKTECEIFVDGMTLSLSQPASTALAMELKPGRRCASCCGRKAQGVRATLTNTLTAPFRASEVVVVEPQEQFAAEVDTRTEARRRRILQVQRASA